MTDRALSEAAMLASLRDIQLPVEAAGGWIADLAATIGVSGLLALGIAVVIRMISFKSAPTPRATLQTRIAALDGLRDEDRRVALLHLLREVAPDRYASLRQSLYLPVGSVGLADLEAEVKRLV